MIYRMSPTASSTYDGQQHLWCVRYRTAAAAVELYYVAAEIYSCSRTATAAAAVTASLHGAALSAIAPPPELEVTPPSRVPPLFGYSSSNRQQSAFCRLVVHGV